MTSDSVGLHGLWVDLLMPLDANLDIHHTKLYTHIQTLAVKGIAGIVLFGPSGEGDAFSCDERIDAIRQLLIEASRLKTWPSMLHSPPSGTASS